MIVTEGMLFRHRSFILFKISKCQPILYFRHTGFYYVGVEWIRNQITDRFIHED